MTGFVTLLAAVVFFEARRLAKQKNKKEAFVFAGLVLLAFVSGWFYISNPNRDSFVKLLFDLAGLKL